MEVLSCVAQTMTAEAAHEDQPGEPSAEERIERIGMNRVEDHAGAVGGDGEESAFFQPDHPFALCSSFIEYRLPLVHYECRLD